ncbi:MAG: hypothetical protein IPK20_02880 [Betaproteobacteria bacterium]|nr:hypothetical protein [Betaproteobacteria bacterium]
MGQETIDGVLGVVQEKIVSRISEDPASRVIEHLAPRMEEKRGGGERGEIAIGAQCEADGVTIADVDHVEFACDERGGDTLEGRSGFRICKIRHRNRELEQEG